MHTHQLLFEHFIKHLKLFNWLMRYFTNSADKRAHMHRVGLMRLTCDGCAQQSRNKKIPKFRSKLNIFLNWWFMMIAFTFPGVFVELAGLWDATSHDCSCSEHNVTMTTDKMSPAVLLFGPKSKLWARFQLQHTSWDGYNSLEPNTNNDTFFGSCSASV